MVPPPAAWSNTGQPLCREEHILWANFWSPHLRRRKYVCMRVNGTNCDYLNITILRAYFNFNGATTHSSSRAVLSAPLDSAIQNHQSKLFRRTLTTSIRNFGPRRTPSRSTGTRPGTTSARNSDSLSIPSIKAHLPSGKRLETSIHLPARMCRKAIKLSEHCQGRASVGGCTENTFGWHRLTVQILLAPRWRPW